MALSIIVGIEIFYPQINGLITTTMNLLKNLQALGHQPVIVTPHIIKDAPDKIDDIPIHYIPSASALTYPGLRLVNYRHPKFKQIIEMYNADIVHTTAPWFIAKGLHRVARKKHIPIVSTFHTNLMSHGYIQYVAPFLNKYTFKIVQAIIWASAKPFLSPCNILTAPSPHTCHDLRKAFPHKRIEWIPNGVETEMFIQPDNSELRLTLIPELVKQKKKYAIFVGRLAQEKSVDILLQGVAHTIKQSPDFHLVIVGDGPKRKAYTQLVANLGLTNNVTFLGKIDHETLMHSGLIHNAQFFYYCIYYRNTLYDCN